MYTVDMIPVLLYTKLGVPQFCTNSKTSLHNNNGNFGNIFIEASGSVTENGIFYNFESVLRSVVREIESIRKWFCNSIITMKTV